MALSMSTALALSMRSAVSMTSQLADHWKHLCFQRWLSQLPCHVRQNDVGDRAEYAQFPADELSSLLRIGAFPGFLLSLIHI